MMQEVPRADVVITNPTHYAVALKYEPEKRDAPYIVAKGVDDIAKKIIDIAKENDVPIVEKPEIAREIYRLVDIDEEIPEKLYKAVAEILAIVFRMKNRSLI
jgi:flagellar biosynthetic protein FlhB